jgi:ribosomal-protein-serine acetyltransferase
VTPFGHDLGDGYSLTLRDLSTVEDVHALVLRNLDRLRAAEPWAWDEQTRAGGAWFVERMLGQYAMDQTLPCVIRSDGRIVGACSATFDSYLGTSSLGYWVDAGSEGHGVARRAASALVDVARSRDMRRVEIRTAATNVRSRRLAERLGFVHEGTLRGALPLGDDRVDVALYGKLF